MKKYIVAIMLIILCFSVYGCADKVTRNEISFNLFKIAGDKDSYVIERFGGSSGKWEKMIIIFGYMDDYSVAKDIVSYLEKVEGKYRILKLK